MIPYTITVRRGQDLNQHATACVFADNRLGAMEQAHQQYPRPEWVLVGVQQHSDHLVPEEWDRL